MSRKIIAGKRYELVIIRRIPWYERLFNRIFRFFQKKLTRAFFTVTDVNSATGTVTFDSLSSDIQAGDHLKELDN